MADPVRVQRVESFQTSGPPATLVIGHVHPDDLARAIRREMAAEIEIIRDDLRKGIDVDDALRWSHDRLTAPAPREPAQERQAGDWTVWRCARDTKLFCPDEGCSKRDGCAREREQQTPTPAGGADPLLPGLRAARDIIAAWEPTRLPPSDTGLMTTAERNEYETGLIDAYFRRDSFLRMLDAAIARREGA